MHNSIKKYPNLRFSEFSDEWMFKELKYIADKRTEKNKDYLYKTVLTNSAVRGVIAQEDYFDRDIVSEGNIDGYYVVKENNFVYNPRISKYAKVGPVKRNTHKTGIMSPLYTIFEFKEGNLDFFEQYFNSHYWHKYMQSISNIGARHDRMNIQDSEFLKIPLPFPDVNEQQRIADFLTAVDDRISAMQKKIELLKKYKKGVMQKIFSQEIRFKDENGNDYPEWEEKKLGDITKLFSDRNKNLIGAPVYSVTNTKGFVLQSDHFDKVVAGDDLRSYKIVKYNDFAYNPARINVGSIARFKNDIGIVSSLYVCFRLTEYLNGQFLEYYLQLGSTHFYFNVFGEGGVRIYLWYPLFSLIKIDLPSVTEQIRIADFLSSIDDKIHLEERRFAESKIFKKSLLQQIFV